MEEKVIIVGVETEADQRYFSEPMEELVQLTNTTSGKVVFTITQKRPQVDWQTIIGKGKLQELVQKADAHEADSIIFNHELTPRQSRPVTDAVGLPVIDRVQLILDTFTMRAHSKEGKLQVELAQLEYLLPHLTRQGKTLSRLGGGIGTRGPGETRLETDRRHTRDKIFAAKKELKEVEAHRGRNRQKKENNEIFQIGLIGYTNAGKSTILNLLTQTDIYSKDQLFAALSPLTKRWRFVEGFEITVTDAVGFIQDLPTQPIDAFYSMLEESQNMNLLLHITDASSPGHILQEQTILELMGELDMKEIPILAIYNKADQIDPVMFASTLFPNVLTSVQTKEGKTALIEAIKRQLMGLMTPYTLSVPSNEGRRSSELRRQTMVLDEACMGESNEYEVRGFAENDSRWLRKNKWNFVFLQ